MARGSTTDPNAKRRLCPAAFLLLASQLSNLNSPIMHDFFHLKRHQTTVSREVVAGITTFAAMAYVLAVNPNILSEAGMDKGAVFTATVVASVITTTLMAVLTNYPIALAPGMGINAFFALTICKQMHIPWSAALGLVFYNGILFLLLSVSGLRRRLIDSIPQHLKIAITCGIGLFIAFIGLEKGGVIVADSNTLVRIGSFSTGNNGALLTFMGIFLTAILVGKKIPGAILIGMMIITVVGLWVPSHAGTAITLLPPNLVSWPASLEPTFLKLDLGYLWQHFGESALPVIALLFTELFDNTGTLLGVCRRANLLDENGELPLMGRALGADAGAAIISSMLGTSSTTSYIESAAGVEAGGRTGLSALVVAVCFLLALFLKPLFLMIPAAATAPALVVVGVFMMQAGADLGLSDFVKAVPSVLIILFMPLAFSISEGIAVGILAHVLMMFGVGRWREVQPFSWILAILFALHFLFR
jgi:adenine/guanine/hypoxanthine permease